MTDLDDAIFRAERYGEPIPGAGTPQPSGLRPLSPLTPAQLAEDAIGLFLEYRDVHGYDEARAAALAVIEVREGVEATAEINAHQRDAVS